MKRSIHNILFFAIAITILSCDRDSIFDDSTTIPKEKWQAGDVVHFEIPIEDTLSYYNLYLNIRNTSDYPNQNLFLFVDTHAQNGATLRDTVECFLANDKGDWLGKGFGRIRDNRIPYRFNVRFASTGIYRFEIQQAMRTETLPGIANVGIRIEKASGKK